MTRRSMSQPRHRIAGPNIVEDLDKITALRHIASDWDGVVGVSPSATTIATAQSMLTSLAVLVAGEHSSWVHPHISASPFGDVIFEWWNGDKQLSIYVSGDEAEYIQTWGHGESVGMDDGDVTSDETRREFWSWFMAA